MKRAQLSLLRQLLVRPRLMLCTVLGVAVSGCLPSGVLSDAISRGLLGWNCGAWLYIVLAGIMMSRATHAEMAQRAEQQDDGRFAILAVVVVASLVSVVAIVAELGLAKDLKGLQKIVHVMLAVLTILSSWAFTQVMFALHYAHEFYANRSGHRAAGLHFPGTTDPGYADFLYCACIVGTSGQTGDVEFTSKPMRVIGLVHSVLAFFFNTTLIALTINIAASFF